MRRAEPFVCIVCGSQFLSVVRVDRPTPRTCSRSCTGSLGRGVPHQRKGEMTASPTYRGLTRYVLRSWGDLYIVWDTETSSRASRPLPFNACLKRSQELERRYGTLAHAA
jgi:hypothetical protein